MERRLLFLLFAMLSCGVLHAQEGIGSIKIVTDPDVAIYCDGEYLGDGGWEGGLPAGVHIFLVESQWFPQIRTLAATVAEGANPDIGLHLWGRITVPDDYPGATVSVGGGQLIRLSETEYLVEPDVPFTVSIESKGNKPFSGEFTLKPAGRITVNPTLESKRKEPASPFLSRYGRVAIFPMSCSFTNRYSSISALDIRIFYVTAKVVNFETPYLEDYGTFYASQLGGTIPVWRNITIDPYVTFRVPVDEGVYPLYMSYGVACTLHLSDYGISFPVSVFCEYADTHSAGVINAGIRVAFGISL